MEAREGAWGRFTATKNVHTKLGEEGAERTRCATTTRGFCGARQEKRRGSMKADDARKDREDERGRRGVPTEDWKTQR